MTEETQAPETDNPETEKEAGEAFAKGFTRIHSTAATAAAEEETEARTESEANTGNAEEGAQAEEPAEGESTKQGAAEKTAAEPSESEKLNKRIRDLEGRIGGLMNKIETLSTAKAADSEPTPTTEQIEEASEDPETLKQLLEDFPEFKPMADEMARMRAQLGKLKSLGDEPAEAILSRIEARQAEEEENKHRAAEIQALEEAYAGWQETVQTPEFLTFALQNGPSETEYAEMSALSEADPAKADQYLMQWAFRYPQWWAEKGVAMFADDAASARRLLDAYASQSGNDSHAKSNDRDKKTQRLRRATQAPSSGAEGTPGVSEDEAFNRGFKRAYGKSSSNNF